MVRLQVVCVGEAPAPWPGLLRIEKLPKRPSPRTVYLVAPSTAIPQRPFSFLCFDPQKAAQQPDRFYDIHSFSWAQVLLAWRTYLLRKYCRKKWRITLLQKAPSIYYFAFDEQLRVVDYNPSLRAVVYALTGKRPKRGLPVLEMVLPQNRVAFQEELRLVQEGHALQVQRPIGSRYAELCILPLRLGKSPVYGYYALDTTLYQRLIETALAQQQLQETLLAHLREGIVVLDIDGHIRYLNLAAERILGGNAVEWLGKPLPFPVEERPFLYKERILWLGTVALDPEGVLVILRDITEMWHSEKLSRLFRTAIQAGPFGVFFLEENNGYLKSFYANEYVKVWLGAGVENYYEALMRKLPQKERKRVEQAIARRDPIHFLLREAYRKQGWSHLEGFLFPVHMEEPAGEKVYWLGILQNQTEMYRAFRRQAQLEARQHQLVLEAQEKERQALAEELHDNVGMLLSVLKMELSALLEEASGEAALREKLMGLSRRLDEVIQVVRLTSHRLMPPLVEHFGLVASLEGLIRRVSLTSPLQISLEVEGEPVELPLMKAIQIYRILQELITNTLRHAQATTMRIRMQYQKRSLVIHVEDDGKGYDPRELSNAGIGLRNIQGRLQTLNARWENLSAPDQGAAYRIEIPLPRKKA